MFSSKKYILPVEQNKSQKTVTGVNGKPEVQKAKPETKKFEIQEKKLSHELEVKQAQRP